MINDQLTGLSHWIEMASGGQKVDFGDRIYIVGHGNHRNVFYQWVDIARQVNKNGEEYLVINSGKSEFSLGKL